MDAATLSKAAGISLARAQLLAVPMEVATTRYGIQTLDLGKQRRLAAFIATCAHETSGFAILREVWGPNAAQRRYEGRLDLGNTQAGDGKRFMGRGWIQLTGRGNYVAASRALGVDLVRNPALLEADDYAALASAWWWKDRELNELADKGDFLAVSIRVNGKNPTTGLPNGWDDRQRRYAVATKALGITP